MDKSRSVIGTVTRISVLLFVVERQNVERQNVETQNVETQNVERQNVKRQTVERQNVKKLMKCQINFTPTDSPLRVNKFG
jgi:hypothetical protein